MAATVVTRTELMVRMGELATSATAGDVLVSIGLGSCIGVCLVDVRRAIVGLVHVMLPFATSDSGPEAKFADRGVERLVDRVRRLGASGLESIIVGGAQMFAFGGSESSQNIGARNESAVRDELKRLNIPIRAVATGGRRGRTVRVHVEGPRVTVREIAGAERQPYGSDA